MGRDDISNELCCCPLACVVTKKCRHQSCDHGVIPWFHIHVLNTRKCSGWQYFYNIFASNQTQQKHWMCWKIVLHTSPLQPSVNFKQIHWILRYHRYHLNLWDHCSSQFFSCSSFRTPVQFSSKMWRQLQRFELFNKKNSQLCQCDGNARCANNTTWCTCDMLLMSSTSRKPCEKILFSVFSIQCRHGAWFWSLPAIKMKQESQYLQTKINTKNTNPSMNTKTKPHKRNQCINFVLYLNQWK